MHLINEHELEALTRDLARGELPADLEQKLLRLAKGGLLHQSIEQNCRLFFMLLLADQDKAFRQLLPAHRERLLRVLAYVRKDEDLIPDYRVEGFTDDQQEVNAARLDLAPVLNSFKAWRLRNQVPRFWSFGIGTTLASS